MSAGINVAEAEEKPQSPPSKPSAARQRAVLATMSGCAALVFGLGASINLAVGRISTSVLHPSATEVLWIIDSYLVAFGCLLIPSGALGDRYGRKAMMLLGLAVLAVGSALSAVAPSVLILLLGRAAAGAGAALILPNSLALLVGSFPVSRHGYAIAVWTAMAGIGGAVGNLLGGLILQFFDWQALFTIAVPLAVIGLMLTAWATPKLSTHDNPLNIGGAFILVVGIFALLFGIIEGPELGWTSSTVLGAFVTAALVFLAFVLHQLRQKYPLLDPRIFRSRVLCAGVLGIVLSFVAMYSLFYLNGQYLMNAHGYSPVLAGFSILPMPLALFYASRQSVRLGERYGSRRTLGWGMAILGTGLALLSFCTPDTAYLYYGLAIGVIGIGSGLSNPLLSTAIISSLPSHQTGVGSGINSFTREIGGALGVALFGTILNGAYAARLPQEVIELTTGQNAAAHKSLEATLAIIKHAGSVNPALVHAAQVAFTDAMAFALRVVLAITALATILVVGWYGSKSTTEPENK